MSPVVAGTILRGTRTTLTAVPVDKLRANPEQPRRHFDAEALAELAASIAQHGILQPIIINRAADVFMIMAGERRFRAA
jgi:ParB family chromosome partitioning protein